MGGSARGAGVSSERRLGAHSKPSNPSKLFSVSAAAEPMILIFFGVCLFVCVLCVCLFFIYIYLYIYINIYTSVAPPFKRAVQDFAAVFYELSL